MYPLNPSNVPTMYLLLRQAHYDLAEPRDSIAVKFPFHHKGGELSTDGYEAE